MKYSPLKFDGRWLWHNADHPLTDSGNYNDHLPEEVFRRLTGHQEKPARVTEMVKAYPTREAAMAALEAADVGESQGWVCSSCSQSSCDGGGGFDR